MTMTYPRCKTIAGAAGAIILLALSACANGPAPPCPSVRVDNTTAHLTKFREGAGRDVTDIEYEAQIIGYQGQCRHHDDGVDVTMDVDFAVTGGPAASEGPISLYYFVAIPQFYPDPIGKKVMVIEHRLSGRGARERIKESGIRVTIPLKESEPAAAYDVYVGLQLDSAQLDYNRSRTP